MNYIYSFYVRCTDIRAATVSVLAPVQTQQKSEDGTDGVLAQKHWFAYRAAQNAIFSLLFNEPVFSRFLAFPTWYHIQHISWYLEDFVISMTTLCLVWEYPKRMRCHGEAGFHCFFFMVWCQPTCLAHITQPQTSSDISFSCGSFKTPWKKYFNIQTFFFLRGRPSTPQWTSYSKHAAKYYMMSFPELIFNFLTSLHEKCSNCLGSHLTACADLIAEVNAASAQMQTSGLTEKFLQN